MTAAAVIPAAGRGDRLGPGTPKALRPLGGAPMLVHAVRAMSAARSIDMVVVAAPPAEAGEVRALLVSHELPAEVVVVAGGATRQASVAAALAVLPEAVDVVLVHDAARPLAPSELADAVVAAVRAGADAVVPVVPVVDTVKVVSGSTVTGTPDRATLRAVQTPQGFRRAVLARAHAQAGERTATDDAGLVEALGVPVHVVDGHPEAFKVTRPLDLVLAEAVLTARRVAGVR